MLLNTMETYVENVRSMTHESSYSMQMLERFMISILYPLYPINTPHGRLLHLQRVALSSFQNFRWMDTYIHEVYELTKKTRFQFIFAS